MTSNSLPPLISAFANVDAKQEAAQHEPTSNVPRSGTPDTQASPKNGLTDSFRRDSQGFWQSGVHLGNKPKLPASPKRYASREPQSPMSAVSSQASLSSSLPSTLFISELVGANSVKYCVTQTLTEGTQGKFRIAKQGEQYFGIKEYRLRDKGPAHTAAVCLQDIEREWHTAQSCNPKLRVHDVIQHGEKVSVITDLFGQDLQRAVKQISPARRAMFVRGAMLDLAEILATMHASGHVHLDLKPANALVAHNCVTLSDFGFATALDARGNFNASHGTPAFLAPERWRVLQPSQNAPKLGAMVDVWALAITWSHLHQLCVPFSFCDATCLGDTFACLDAYETFLQQVMTPQGQVDRARILAGAPKGEAQALGRESHHQTLVDDFYRWAQAALEVDEEVFIYLLGGPLQVTPEKRPTMGQMAHFLRSRMALPDVRFYMAITKRLTQAARYTAPEKGTGGQSLSNKLSEKRSYTVGQIKSDLQAFSETSESSQASGSPRGSVGEGRSGELSNGYQGITAPS